MASRTPLRRVSQGSLFALSRSGTFPDAPTGLGFLQPALTEFADETDTLLTNVDGMVNLSESLSKFNEAFASWLYILNMNALTTDWPQVGSVQVYHSSSDSVFRHPRTRRSSWLNSAQVGSQINLRV